MMTKHILAVAINSTVIDPYRTRLTELGVHIDVCEFYEKAAEILWGDNFDAVIMQIVNSEKGRQAGLDMLVNMRERHLKAKVLVISSSGSLKEKNQMLKMGAAYYFEPPVFAPDLFMALRDLNVLSTHS
jgi:DNA-binding NtrC family response regulator